MSVPWHERRVQQCERSGAWRSLWKRKVDRRQELLVEGNGDGGGCGYRRDGNERRCHRHASAARRTGGTLAGLMMRRGMMVGLHVRTGMLVMKVSSGHVGIVSHRFMVVTVQCRRWRHTEGHRRGSEALERHRQQRHPDDQDSQDGFHAPILAYAKVSAIPWVISECCGPVSCEHVIFACARLIYMRPFVRILMLWILIVSLPVQGIAAAITSPCTMVHSSSTSPDVTVMDDCDEHEMTMPMAESKAKANASADAAHQDTPCDNGSHQKHSSCRACSAGYVGASAPPPFAVAAFPAEQFATDYVSPISSFTGWIPSRIERPPRV